MFSLKLFQIMGFDLRSRLKTKNISLRTWLLLAMLLCFFVLVVSYSLLASYLLSQGMKEMVAYNLQSIAISETPSKIYYLPQVSKSPIDVLDHPSTPSTYPLKIPAPNNTDHLDSWVFHQFQHDFNTKYVSFVNASGTDLSRYRLLTSHHVFMLLIATAFTFFLFFLLVFWFVFRTIDRPISILVKWANSLTIHTLSHPIPNFVYPELNKFAHLLHHSVKEISLASERERRFLAYTSHELRTPLSIIISNTEILKYFLHQVDKPINEKIYQAVDRLERSTKEMQGLAHSVLWLDRGSESISPETIDVTSLLENILQPYRQTLATRQIKVHTQLEPVYLETYRFPFIVVLNNVIKNAFQHTLEGDIYLILKPTGLEVKNTLTQSKYGYGVGLELIRRMTEKLGLGYTAKYQEGYFYTHIAFTSSKT
ncbi:MAG: HAMP domain-containing sensor histidine kinase [Neisseriaceae bacterium]